MLTTGPGPHRVTRRWTSGRGSGRSRSDDLRGAERIRALREPPGEVSQRRDGFAHFQTRRSGDK
jgi:hypothetical protein